jgi:SAM-dependent methyltransferase
MTKQPDQQRASLEQLLENGIFKAEILHPGGLEITSELAALCRLGPGDTLLDVASGSGEAACFLARRFQCHVVGIDASEFMVGRARQKAQNGGLDVEFRQGDAHALPFGANTFDTVISECTTCILDKQRAIREMVRVVKPGGHVGIHDLCWKHDASDILKQQLAELEGERPETLEGWKKLFEEAGLIDIVILDKSSIIPSWMKDMKRQLGLIGEVKILWQVFQRWGLRGVLRIKKSERIFRSKHMGYGVIVGRKKGDKSNY